MTRRTAPRARRLLAALAAAALALVASASLAGWLAPDAEAAPVTEESFRRIELGMARGDVEAILGTPPVDSARAYRLVYCGGTWKYRGAEEPYASVSNQDLADLRPVSSGGSIAAWPGSDAEALVVEFDADGTVYGVALLTHGVAKPSAWERFVKRWFGR
jgi:hypothetical protein